MELSILHECTTSGGIACPPMPMRKKKKKIAEDYMGIAKGKHPINDKTKVWQPLKPKKQTHWYQKYAETNDPDERLLKNYRGHGY